MTREKINLGTKGEELVSKYLETKNFIILKENYSTKFGEIDIIAQKNNLVVFVEVKLRRNPKFYLSDLISLSKQKKIIKTALNYIAINNLSYNICRFDVALIELIQKDYNINYIENAFTKLD